MALHHRKILGGFALAALLIGFSQFLRTQTASPPEPTRANVNDFVAYWSAARQAIDGGNPYAETPALDLERQAGFTGSKPLIMRNPPWTLAVVAPFGLLPFAAAQWLWLAIGIISVFTSANVLADLYRADYQSPWIAWLAVAFFSPLAVVLAIGQIGPLVLLGIAGFIHFEKQAKFRLAGMCLFLVALKPHLVLLVWVAVLLWSVRIRSVRTLSSFTAVTFAASLVAVIIDHSIFLQYLGLLSKGVVNELTPTFSGLLRSWFGGYYIIQLVPAILALSWLLHYWCRVRDHWQWRDEMPLLLLASLLTTPYGWFFDQIILLPCVFQVTGWLASGRSSIRFLIAGLYLGVNAVVLTLIRLHYTTFWYVWTVPAWVGLYLMARHCDNCDRVLANAGK
jgi:hypothetical protein